MGILNRLFGSSESVAKGIEYDRASIVKHWRIYVQSVPKKKAIVEKIDPKKINQNIFKELEKLLELELVEIHVEERDEKDLISDLETLEHDQKVKRVHRLEESLAYVETKYVYVYKLLEQIYLILKIQKELVENLLCGAKQPEIVISHLQAQLHLELAVLQKIEQIETFHDLFSTLVNGEHVIHVLDADEKKLLQKMQKGMGKIFAKEINSGVTHKWAFTVLNAIEDDIHQAVADGILEHHRNVEFEYVNRPEFVGLAREAATFARGKDVSEQMLTVFVHIFREWFNDKEWYK